MKKTAILITAIILICGLLGIFWDGYLLPKKPCRPIIYPSGARTTDEMSYISSDAYEEVVKYYDINLSPKDISIANFGEWVREMISPSTFLYQCYSPDINGLTTESGCIYVRNTGEVTSIEIQFYRSEGGYVPCPR